MNYRTLNDGSISSSSPRLLSRKIVIEPVFCIESPDAIADDGGSVEQGSSTTRNDGIAVSGGC
jgi:hypothetical protein